MRIALQRESERKSMSKRSEGRKEKVFLVRESQ